MTKSGQKALKIQENYRNLHVESLQRLLQVAITGDCLVCKVPGK